MDLVGDWDLTFTRDDSSVGGQVKATSHDVRIAVRKHVCGSVSRLIRGGVRNRVWPEVWDQVMIQVDNYIADTNETN